MTSSKPALLVATDVVEEVDIRHLSRYRNLYMLSDLGVNQLRNVLPEVDSLLVFSWPRELDDGSLQKMSRLKFIQSILAGVNHIPFASLSEKVVVCSNAGAYSDEVAEYAWALLLAAAKRVVELHVSLSEERWTLRRTLDKGTEVNILKNGIIGVLGFGGIGRAVATIASGFGVQVYAYARRSKPERGVRIFTGPDGLSEVLKRSDSVILALPLTTQTSKIINQERLQQMKKSGILVNIARGELVDEKAIYNHLLANPNFRYATDVWWYRESRESLKTDFPFLSLPNFVGTPHVSGPSGLATGRPAKLAVENMIRYLKGQEPRNIVDRAEYITSYPY